MVVSSKVTRRPVPPPSRRVRLLAWAVVAWCLAFAVVNVVYEATDHFARGAYGQYAAGISVMSWLVVALKVLGAVVALLTVTSRWPTISANLRTWAGIVAAPVVLAVVLLAVTAALGALGLLPTT